MTLFYNKKRNNTKGTVAASIFTLAIIMAASNMAAVPALATTTPPTSQSGIELSPQPVYQEQVRDEGETPINQTHIQLSFSGNGTLTLPNSTEPIKTISRGSGIASMMGTFAGKEILTTEDGSESATATFYEIVRFGEQQGRGIAIAVFETNSTGILAPLNGMIMVGQDELPQEGNSTVTLWEWQSGIPLPSMSNTAGQPPLANTSMTTNATTTDTNATATTAPPEEDEEGGDQQQQTTTIAPNPLFE
jgi:hypothetical protein